jgi:hypothetical protein
MTEPEHVSATVCDSKCIPLRSSQLVAKAFHVLSFHEIGTSGKPILPVSLHGQWQLNEVLLKSGS